MPASDRTDALVQHAIEQTRADEAIRMLASQGVHTEGTDQFEALIECATREMRDLLGANNVSIAVRAPQLTFLCQADASGEVRKSADAPVVALAAAPLDNDIFTGSEMQVRLWGAPQCEKRIIGKVMIERSTGQLRTTDKKVVLTLCNVLSLALMRLN